MRHNEAQARKIRGGSTVSQQTAKNVFLWPERSWVRKGAEAWFTVLIEAIWGKRRIMEVYLNTVEMGSGIYGVEAASQRYFHEPASRLSPAQADRIVAILPSPLKWSAAHPGAYVRNAPAGSARAREPWRAADWRTACWASRSLLQPDGESPASRPRQESFEADADDRRVNPPHKGIRSVRQPAPTASPPRRRGSRQRSRSSVNSGRKCRKNGVEYRATPRRSGAGLTTRWVVEGRTPRWSGAHSMSPMLTTTAPGGGFTASQRPSAIEDLEPRLFRAQQQGDGVDVLVRAGADGRAVEGAGG